MIEESVLIEVHSGYKGSERFYVTYPECVFGDEALGIEDPQTGVPMCPFCGGHCCSLLRVESKAIKSGVGWICSGWSTLKGGGCSRTKRHA